MVTTYETLTLMITFSMLVLAIINTIIQILIYQQHSRNHKNTKK